MSYIDRSDRNENSFVEAYIKGEWVKFDFQSADKYAYDKYPVFSKLIYLGSRFPYRLVNTDDYGQVQGKWDQGNCGHIWRKEE